MLPGKGPRQKKIAHMVMEKVCHTCGVVGWLNSLLTCSQCKTSCMHTYCLRIPLDEPINDWHCEECESQSVQEALASNQMRELPGVSKLTHSHEVHNGSEPSAEISKSPNNSRKGPFCWEKGVERGKTKYIPVMDAIKLSSRDIYPKSSSKVALLSKPSRSNNVSEQTPIQLKYVPQSFSPQKDPALGPNTTSEQTPIRPTYASQSFVLRKLPALRPNTISEQIPTRPTYAPLSFSPRKNPALGPNTISEQTPIRPTYVPVSFSHRKGPALGPFQQPKAQIHGSTESSKGRPVQFRKPTEVQRSVYSFEPSKVPKDRDLQKEQPLKIQLPHTKLKSAMKQPLPASPRKASPVTISGAIGHSPIGARNQNTTNASNGCLSDLGMCSRTPAVEALWKGRFSITDGNQELNCHFQAHPPSTLHRKIYEFSKRMPEVLHFQLVPFQKLWTRIFQGQMPDERDIGLYFFPSIAERSADNIFLVGSIGRKNLALRKQIADVELLIFTSELLPNYCQFWNGNHFLWGLFHRLKLDAASTQLENRGTRSCVQPSQHSPIQVKIEHSDLTPPGFADAHRLKFQQSASSTQNFVIPKRKRKEPDDRNK